MEYILIYSASTTGLRMYPFFGPGLRFSLGVSVPAFPPLRFLPRVASSSLHTETTTGAVATSHTAVSKELVAFFGPQVAHDLVRRVRVRWLGVERRLSISILLFKVRKLVVVEQ